MIIELRRAHSPEEMVVEECAVCGLPFLVESVVADVSTAAEEGEHMGAACFSCVHTLGGVNPDKFPTAEEFEEAKRRHPEPMFASVEEICALEREDLGAAYDALEAGWISR